MRRSHLLLKKLYPLGSKNLMKVCEIVVESIGETFVKLNKKFKEGGMTNPLVWDTKPQGKRGRELKQYILHQIKKTLKGLISIRQIMSHVCFYLSGSISMIIVFTFSHLLFSSFLGRPIRVLFLGIMERKQIYPCLL